MAVKSEAQDWTVKEQIIEDLVNGLTFQFERLPNGRLSFRIFGDSLRFGNREFQFYSDGTEARNGVVPSGLCRSAWVTKLD